MEIDTDSDGDADSDEEIESKFEGEKRSWSRHIAKALYKFLEIKMEKYQKYRYTTLT